jgi:hypothetical protein
MPGEHAYWFRAKRYGWGWGIPTCWQGWAVLLVYSALVGAAVLGFPPRREPFIFALLVTVLSLLLVAVCWLKEEPPRWRWGED